MPSPRLKRTCNRCNGFLSDIDVSLQYQKRNLVEHTCKFSYNSLSAAILEILPNAQFGEDNDGQIVIYTSLRQIQGQDQLAEFSLQEENETPDPT